MLIMIILSIIALIFTIYFNYYVSFNERKIYTISLTALFCGLTIETYKITKNWKIVRFPLIGSYLIILFTILPFRSVVIFEDLIKVFSYVLIFIFALFISFDNNEKTTSNLTEGVTLIQSLSLIYWITDFYLLNSENIFAKIILIIALIITSSFTIFSIYHALTYTKLSNTIRLTLSIWSTLIMITFSIINILSILQNDDINNSNYISQVLNIVLQYFLLGISVFYIVQNHNLIVNFLPGKHDKLIKAISPELLIDNKTNHLERYAENQVKIEDSMFCILYAIILYGLNLILNFLPSLTLIWLVIFTFPVILNITKKISKVI